jgi:hypothetical protein
MTNLITHIDKYGLIQTDTTNNIVVYSFLAWLIIVYNDAFLYFSMQQSDMFYISTCNYHMTNKIRIILLILDFKLGMVDNRNRSNELSSMDNIYE